ncbi:winged helix-turn-helix domain-containing protein [Streptomyces sp. NBC_01288]|uniref:hypothetical protein n=1 Tax=unclassified Streptomyces TaxID=2593676 RepID=UPI002E0D6B45|nr:winged helix-turn-helix domain-containing protein [Streptomyces sp. NBC_01288]
MEETRTLETALEVAQQQLAAAEHALVAARERAHREVTAAREQVQRLSMAVYSLRDVLAAQGVDPGQLPQVSAHVSAEAGTAHVVGTAEGATLDTAAVDVHQPTGLEPRSSTDRAVAILADAGRPMRMSELRREWVRRGWVNPNWKTPDAAITMAFHRARKARKVGRMLDGSWVLPMMVRDELARARHQDDSGGGGDE